MYIYIYPYGEKVVFLRETKTKRQGNTHPDAMLVRKVVALRKTQKTAGQHSPGRNVFIHRCIHMYAYCIHMEIV